MQKIGPGIYISKDGGLHVSAAEICEALGYPPTPGNMAVAEEAARDAFAAHWPEASIKVVDA
jgi:hypothetical protein